MVNIVSETLTYDRNTTFCNKYLSDYTKLYNWVCFVHLYMLDMLRYTAACKSIHPP